MRLSDYIFYIAPKAASYRLARAGLVHPSNPLTLTFSVTSACQSRCLTCNIGRRYQANPKIVEGDLTLSEIESIFATLGHIYFFNVSGGEPFLRPDLAEIMRLACIHLKPRLIHIPTNALMPGTIETTVRKILLLMDQNLPASVPLSVKPSIDGVGPVHDHLRGVPGSFARLEQTLDRLLALRAEHPRLHVDLGTVISNHNLHHLDELESWVHTRDIECYRHEVAEQRFEFDNIGSPITPPPDLYDAVARRFGQRIRQNIGNKPWMARTTEAVRLEYYSLAADIMRTGRQVSPCFAGIANIHLNFDGEVWPCCVLGSDHSMGQVRRYRLDMQALLRSDRARQVRRTIARGHCACPLANQWLNNILLSPAHMTRVLRTWIQLVTTPKRHPSAV